MYNIISDIKFISDGNIKFIPYKNDGYIARNFSQEDWNKSVFDINDDKEWNAFLKKYCELVSCFLLYDCKRDNNIGFVYLYDEGDSVISVHGGGWVKSVGHTLLYYRAMIVMSSFLLSNGFKVHTSCLVDNMVAFRFLKCIGYVKYRTSCKAFYMWINVKRLENSRVYMKLYNGIPSKLIVSY